MYSRWEFCGIHPVNVTYWTPKWCSRIRSSCSRTSRYLLPHSKRLSSMISAMYFLLTGEILPSLKLTTSSPLKNMPFAKNRKFIFQPSRLSGCFCCCCSLTREGFCFTIPRVWVTYLEISIPKYAKFRQVNFIPDSKTPFLGGTAPQTEKGFQTWNQTHLPAKPVSLVSRVNPESHPPPFLEPVDSSTKIAWDRFFRGFFLGGERGLELV